MQIIFTGKDMFFTFSDSAKVSFTVYNMCMNYRKGLPMNRYEANPARWDTQFDNAVYSEDSGMENAALCEKVMQLYEEAEAAGKPFAVTRAELVAFYLDHARIAVNDFDMFVTLVQRTYLSSVRFGNPMMHLQGVRNRKFLSEISGEEAGYTVCWLDLSHTSPDWDAILTLGIPGLLARAEKRFAETPCPFTESVKIVYTAFRRFTLRFADVAKKGNRADLAEMLRFLADNPPETLQQALQLGLLYRHLQEMEGQWVRSMGIFDRQYLPFYERDIAAGRLTEESAQELLDCYFSRFQAESNGKSAGAPFCFGGYLPGSTQDGCNTLTRLAWNSMRTIGKVDPKFSLRVNPDTPDDIMMQVASCIQDGKNATVFVNDVTARKMFLRNGKEESDLANWIPIGCYEPAIMGKELSCTMSGLFNLAKVVEKVLADGREYGSFEEFFQAGLAEMKAALTGLMAISRQKEQRWNDVNPTPSISGTFHECMERAKDVSQAGAKYNTSGIMFAGIGTAVDSFSAVNYLVYETKKCTLAQLREILATNWEGAEMLRQEVIARSPKWGCGNAFADTLAKTITDTAGELMINTPNAKGGHYQLGLWSIDYSLHFGKQTGATPDGRKNADPISKNAGCTIGCDREGIAGLLESAGKLDYTLFADGSVLDVMLTPRHAAGPEGVQMIAGIVRKYFADGGYAIHFNILSPETLRAAQKHPEQYQNLQVRVCGWNARFVDLSQPMQDCMIREAESKD